MSVAKIGYYNKIAIGQFYYRFIPFRNMKIFVSVSGSALRQDSNKTGTQVQVTDPLRR
jgi:hypothetical protein